MIEADNYGGLPSEYSRVDTAKVVKAMDSPAVEACALQIVSDLRFPAPYKGKPVTLLHPVRFTPPQGDVRVGRLRPAAIQSGFAAASADFRACYDAAAKATKPDLKGSLTIALRVGVDGSVKTASLKEDTLRIATLGDCVLARVRDLHFPRPELDGEVDVEYPLNFAPAGPAPK